MEVVVVMASVYRTPSNVTIAAVNAAMNCDAIQSVHVWGYDPTFKTNNHALRTTLFHRALVKHQNALLNSVLSQGNKYHTVDDVNRILWRSKLALDMWQVLQSARKMFPTALLVWLENDAIVDCTRLKKAILLLTQLKSKALSCWGNTPKYNGSGLLCFLFTPEACPERHLLAYHMVQPADWIIAEYSNGTWPVFNAVQHGFDGRHKSTRLIHTEVFQ